VGEVTGLPGSAAVTSRAQGTAPAARRRRLIGAAAALVLAVAVAVVLVAGRGGGATPRTAEPTTHARSSADTYGGLPSWLPKATVPVGRILRASAAHPVLAIEGDAVTVGLSTGRATVTTVGPEVPEEGRFPVPATTPCRFDVSFAAGRGAVPLRSSAFTIVDELGHLHRPHITLRGGGPVPALLPQGRIVTLTMSAVLPTGGGRLRWAPQGGRPLVAWDFDVEID
jgi:hypothetical protein